MTHKSPKMSQDLTKTMEEDTNPKYVPWWTSSRFTLSIVGFFGTICLYMMRANMSVAIVCMTTDLEPENSTSYSSMDGSLYQVGEFTWSRELRGWVLSSFYVGYFMTQLPAGWLANKLGAKVIILAGMSMLTILTLLTPIAARGSVYLLLVVQALKGFASGVYYPTFYQFWGRWAPPKERTVLMAIFTSGTPVGSIISSILSGYLCDYGFDGGWPSIFYVMGTASAVWCVVWYFMGFSSPEEHPRISEEERDYIQSSLLMKAEVKTLRVPWRSLLTTVPLYAIFVVDVCYNWGWYVALSSLPQYMKDVFKFDMSQNGLYNSLPYISNFIMTIGASLMADFIISRRLMKITWTRKLCQSIGMVPSAGIAIGVAYLTSDDTTLAVVLLTFWVGLMGFVRSGALTNQIDMAPRFSGIIQGIDNTLCTIPGIIAPPIIGSITKTGATEEWQTVFFFSAGIYLIGWVVYMIFGNAEQQKWSMTEADTEEVVVVVGGKDNPTYTDAEDPLPHKDVSGEEKAVSCRM